MSLQAYNTVTNPARDTLENKNLSEYIGFSPSNPYSMLNIYTIYLSHMH
jgi:hypothetical protein